MESGKYVLSFDSVNKKERVHLVHVKRYETCKVTVLNVSKLTVPSLKIDWLKSALGQQ